MNLCEYIHQSLLLSPFCEIYSIFGIVTKKINSDFPYNLVIGHLGREAFLTSANYTQMQWTFFLSAEISLEGSIQLARVNKSFLTSNKKLSISSQNMFLGNPK